MLSGQSRSSNPPRQLPMTAMLRSVQFWHRAQRAAAALPLPLLWRGLGASPAVPLATSWPAYRSLSTFASGTPQAITDSIAHETARAARALQQPPHTGHHPHQTVDYTTLAAVVQELRQSLCPSKVEQTLQVDDETVVLKLRTLETTMWLQLSWHSITGHIATVAAPERSASAAEAYSFGTQLHSSLRGLVLSGVELPAAWERVVRLDFAPRPSEPALQQLHCEIMGRYSNLVLTDGSGTISAAGYQVGGRMSSLRQVQAGRQYQLPPPAPGIDPDPCPTQQEWQQTVQLAAQQVAAASAGGSRGSKGGSSHSSHAHTRGTVADGCVRAFRGVSPSLVRELCQLAGASPEALAAQLSAADWAALYAQWQAWLGRLQAGSFVASTCPQRGAYSVLGTYPVVEEGVLGMLGSYYSRLHATDQFEQMKHKLQRVISQAVQRLEKKMQSLYKQGGQSDKHLHTQKLADLLMSNLHRCSPGMASIVVEDWDAPGTLLTIPLDPLKPAIESAEALYRQARKQRRGVKQVVPLIAEAEAQLEYLREVELLLSQAEEEGPGGGDMAALRDVQSELVAGGYMKPPPEAALAAKVSSKAKRAQKRAGGAGLAGGAAGYREYRSPGGLRVLVGRNSRQNDELTMRLANEGDVWMHARGVPGAHVLLRVPSGQVPSDADIQFAADLAVWFSKARTEGRADVTTACPSNIKKPRGAKPGQVLVTKETVVVGRPHLSAAASMGEQD